MIRASGQNRTPRFFRLGEVPARLAQLHGRQDYSHNRAQIERKPPTDLLRLESGGDDDEAAGSGYVAALALGAAGCLPLMVGSLGYEGYEYHKTGTLPGMPPSQSSSSSSSTAKQAAHKAPSPSPDEFE